jgi:hypothetical protein
MVTKRVLTVTALAGMLGALAAHESGRSPRIASAQGPHLEGAWTVTITQPTPGQPPLVALHTYAADGSLLVSSPLMQRSVGHGAWVRTGNREYGRTWVQLRFDDKGAFVGTTKVRSIVRLNDSADEWVGVALRSDTFDATGKLVSSSTGGATDQGKRIRVETP